MILTLSPGNPGGPMPPTSPFYKRNVQNSLNIIHNYERDFLKIKTKISGKEYTKLYL